MCVVQTLAQTAMVVGAMTSHDEVVAWCTKTTSARPWIAAKTLVCGLCCLRGVCTLSRMCKVDFHAMTETWTTSAFLCACRVGDFAMVQRLTRDSTECVAALRGGTMRDQVRAAVCVRGV